jgi:Ca-activated chloride channel family protein
MMKLLLARIVPPNARVFVAAFLICFCFCEIRPPLAAQFASGVDLVEVYAAVTDARGAPVQGLTRDDFLVQEDGQRREIRTFASGEFPLALAVGIDRSFSMARVGLPGVVNAVGAFLTALRPEDQTMVVGIGSETEVLAPLSRDRAPARAALEHLDAWGTTPLYDATLSAIDAIESASGRRALILVSDGSDRYSRTRADDLLEQVRRKDVLIYPIALAKTPDAVFPEMATVTGGRSFQVPSVAALSGALLAVADDLRCQYLLGYSPAPSRVRAPGWRSIQVHVNRPNVRVRARDGYVAP